MSYILEALKKAEQRYQGEKAPDLAAFSGEGTRERRKAPLWPYLLFAVLLLNAGLIFLWLSPWRQDEPRTPARQQAVHQAVSAAVSETVSKEEPRLGDRGAPSAKGVDEVPPRSSIKEASAPSAVKAEKPRATGRPSAEAPARVEARVPPDGKVLSLNELPAAVRNSLPELNVSGHAYSSDPHARVVRVNDKILQEGQALTPGLRVEEIIPGGIVFNYQGYRFRVGTREIP